ncbi:MULTISPECIES: chemotaxis protein CheA [unclassified Phaeobacter]|uniref:chemotaxis protein CheA n=1 Tax=unclassified Phaeobacter TaxID=2621772 RepID=UPI003A8418F9
MVQNNKVLTVSYGTFSCTLEGFDDSFGTMKAIAEYFRDLASDDRYFGAEPPQPDAEMLARIAQREVARQVEARTSAEGIHLRAATLPPPPQQTAPPQSATPPRPAAQQASEETSQHRATGALAAPAAPAPVSAAEPTDPTARTAPASAPKARAPLSEPSATPVAEVKLQPVQQAAPTSAAARIAAAPAAAAASALAAQDAPDDSGTAATADAETNAESIAAKLRRIRAVVAKTPVDEFTEDQHAEQAREEAVKEITNALSADHDAVDAPRAADGQIAAQELDENDEDDAAIAAALNRLDLGNTPSVPATPSVPNVPEGAEEFFADSSSATDDTEADSLEDDLDERVAPLSETAQPQPAKAEVQQAEVQQAERAPEETSKSETAAETPAAPETAAPRKRGRVLRIKRRDIEGAMADGTLEKLDDTAAATVPDTPPATPAAPAPEVAETSEAGTEARPETRPETRTGAAPKADPETHSSLSPDDEAELLAELAAVEADLLGSDDDEAFFDDEDDEDEDSAAPAAAVRASPRTDAPLNSAAEAAAAVAPGSRRGATSTADSDIARLMAAADERLEDPENTTSRETYSQLRAVMAAASTERSAGGALEAEDDAQVYRDDLASVVRPRRPESRETADQRPAKPASRPAPLQLVQEQRIDDSAAAPVRPRRVSAAVLAEEAPRNSGSDGGFAAYAAKSGAVELAELLEAAAAYMSFVEGRDHFSRPQLMNKVRDVDGTDFNREDGLRSFGQLLREGKIERADNGRFTASGQIGFQPGNRAAG